MAWMVIFHEDFEPEFDRFDTRVQDAIFARARLVEMVGPNLGRPYADRLAGSAHANMKELRCRVDDAVWRVAFAFDPHRRAVLLVAGDKAGAQQRRFYRHLIRRADARLAGYLDEVGKDD